MKRTVKSKDITIEEAKKDFDLIKRALNNRRLCPCAYCESDKCVPLPGECLKDDFVINIALEALEKQIPKKVNYEADGYADGHLVYDDAYCPSCGMAFESTDVLIWEGNYCPECGQRLYWEHKDG